MKTKDKKIPFIAHFAEKQKDTRCTFKTYYDEKRDVTMVKGEKGNLPLVQMQDPVVELMTKTEAIREQDDYNLTTLAEEYLTKTAVARESDETDVFNLELFTKTFEERESDDVSSNTTLTEIYTKTKQEREGDDVSDEAGLL